MAEHEEKEHATDEESIIKEALELFDEAAEDTAGNRENYDYDVQFGRLGEQWPAQVKQQRQDEGRPCLTVNRCPSFVRQVVNDARQNKPSIIVHPVDNGADVDTAEVINGIIRTIERNSCAATAYDTSIENAVSGGFGFFRIGIDFANEDSFDMEIKIDCVPNSLSVYWDTNTTRFDAADWNYAFIIDVISEDEFETRYPDAEKSNFEGGESNSTQEGLDDDEVRIAEYWRREEVKQKLFLLSDGRSIRDEQLTDEVRAILEITGVTIVKEREVRAHKVTRRVISGKEILEEDDWPGETIPICPVWGEVVTLGGVRYLRSMIRDAIGPQQMLNYWKSASTELVALAPKAPYIGEEGFVPEGDEDKWATANTRSHAFLQHTKGTPMPQRQPFAGPPAGALQEALNASDDMKSVIGVFDASLGARGNETSGKAILARQRESDVGQFHFIDNQARAIEYAGKVITEIIPHVYTARTTMRIVGADEKEKVVNLASGQLQPDKQSGDERLYDLNVGRYDVTVKAGPSYASQREETREALIEIMRSVPGAGQVIGDIVLEHMDFQNADKVAKRMKFFLPPEVRKAEAEEGQESLPPEAQQAIAVANAENVQLKQQLQQGSQVLQEGQQKLQALEGDKQAEMGKLQIEQGKLELDQQRLELERAKEQAGIENERLKIQAGIDIDRDKLQADIELQSEKLQIDRDKLELERAKAIGAAQEV